MISENYFPYSWGPLGGAAACHWRRREDGGGVTKQLHTCWLPTPAEPKTHARAVRHVLSFGFAGSTSKTRYCAWQRGTVGSLPSWDLLDLIAWYSAWTGTWLQNYKSKSSIRFYSGSSAITERKKEKQVTKDGRKNLRNRTPELLDHDGSVTNPVTYVTVWPVKTSSQLIYV